jgi:hypothetical protein
MTMAINMVSGEPSMAIIHLTFNRGLTINCLKFTVEHDFQQKKQQRIKRAPLPLPSPSPPLPPSSSPASPSPRKKRKHGDTRLGRSSYSSRFGFEKNEYLPNPTADEEGATAADAALLDGGGFDFNEISDEDALKHKFTGREPRTGRDA